MPPTSNLRKYLVRLTRILALRDPESPNPYRTLPSGYHQPTASDWRAAQKKVISHPGVITAFVVLGLIMLLLLYVAQRVWVVRANRGRTREAAAEGGPAAEEEGG